MIQATRALFRNEPGAVLASLEHAYSDNRTPAIPIKCEDGVVTVALVVRDVEALLGNRRPGTTAAGNPSLSVWPKRDRNGFYVAAILSDIVATAKEGFADAPGVSAINVVVIRRTGQEDGGPVTLDAVLRIEVPRSAVVAQDWSRTTPSEALNEAPVVLNQNPKSLALTSITATDHPDVELAMRALGNEAGGTAARGDAGAQEPRTHSGAVSVPARPDAAPAVVTKFCAEPKMLEIGQKGRDGSQGYVVKGVREVESMPRATQYSSGGREAGLIGPRRGGRLVCVDIDFYNDGRESVDIYCSADLGMALIDRAGRKYDPLDDLYLIEGNTDCNERIQPGFSTSESIVFEIPEDAARRS
jgi:hypothetical protein